MTRIETEITISATPQEVWAVLMDFEKYGEWNPFIKEISGDKFKDGRLKISVAQPQKGCHPSEKTMNFSPRVTVFEEGKMFAWRGVLGIAPIFAGVHYFRLQPAGKGTLFTHGEEFSGLLAEIMKKQIKQDWRMSFEAMNRALAKKF